MLLVLGFVLSGPASPEGVVGYLAQIRAHTVDEVEQVLVRAEQLTLAGLAGGAPIVLVLHGDEALAFTRSRYLSYRPVVDLAARLDALGIVDVRVCETWMQGAEVEDRDVLPFVERVAYGPAEEVRLQREGYVAF